MARMKAGSVVAIISVLVGCVGVSRDADLVGDYLWETRMARLVLRVNADHSYSESVEWKSGDIERVQGIWALKDERIVFEGMVVPSGALPTFPSSSPDSPIVVRRSPGPRRCEFSPERHFGGPVMLVADPDSDLGFRQGR